MNAHIHAHTRRPRYPEHRLPPTASGEAPGAGLLTTMPSILENVPHSVMLTAVCVCEEKGRKEKTRNQKRKPKNPLILQWLSSMELV